jgi:hypothetical protein
MPAHDLKQIGRGPRCINSILRRLQAVEPEFAVLVAAELATKVMAGLVLGVEDVVLAVGASLPHVEDGVGDTFAGFGILDDTMEERELAVFWHVLDYAAAKIPEWGVGRPEGAKDSRGCGREVFVGYDLVVDLIDETGWKVLAIGEILLD